MTVPWEKNCEYNICKYICCNNVTSFGLISKYIYIHTHVGYQGEIYKIRCRNFVGMSFFPTKSINKTKYQTLLQ